MNYCSKLVKYVMYVERKHINKYNR